MAAWISALSLATLAIVAAVTAYLGWWRSTLFRESFSSLSIELSCEKIWADESLTLLVLSDKLKNTSRVMTRIESAEWRLTQMAADADNILQLFSSSDGQVSYQDFWLEPQEEDVIFSEIWTGTPQAPQPMYAQVEVRCPRYKNTQHRSWIRRIHFVLEDFNA